MYQIGNPIDLPPEHWFAAARLPAVGGSAAFFDLDKTVIAKSSALAFGRPFYRDGLISRRDVIKGAYGKLCNAWAAATSRAWPAPATTWPNCAEAGGWNRSNR